MFLNDANSNIVVICSGSYLLTMNVYFVIFGFQTFRFMQFAGKTPPPSIIILFVTFFPLQGFFNLVVYMFPRILRYFEEGTPLTQSFRRSSFLSSLRSSSSGVRSSKLFSKKSSSQKPTELGSGFSQEESGVGKTSSAFVSEEGGADEKRNSQVSFAEGIVQDGDAQSLELDDGGDKEKDMDEEDEIEDGGAGREEGEKDAIDELERIVEA